MIWSGFATERTLKHFLAFALLTPLQPLTVSAAAAARLALFALIHRLVASHQHMNRIPGILRVGVLAEAVRRH
jgi:hypothetical protein